MNFRRFSWKLLLVTAFPVALALLGTLWFVNSEMRQVHEEDVAEQLRTHARLLREVVQKSWPEPDPNAEAIARSIAADGTRVVVVRGDGLVLLDTAGSSDSTEALLSPESKTALLVGRGEAVRAEDDGASRKIVALRVGSDAEHVGVVRLSRPLTDSFRWTGPVGRTLVFVALVGLATILFLAYVQTRRAAALLLRITQAARNVSAGDLSVKVEGGGSRELELLARAVNQMRQRMAAQVDNMDRQRRTFEALLTQLREGVVVVGSDDCIVLLNPSAVRLLNLAGPRDGRGFTGLAVERCIPQLELQRLLATRGRRSPADGPTDPRNQWETRLQVETASGVVYLLAQVSEILLPSGPDGETAPTVGRLLVLTDISDLTRNIQMKTDFVANASHELRTPLSTIRAAVETLHQLDYEQDGESAARFVEVIDRQSARLEALASDLLDLSRVESGSTRFAPRSLGLADLLTQLQAQFADPLQRRGVRLEIDAAGCSRSTVQANPQLLRLVLDNILDNAIKFSEPGDTVRLVCRGEDESLTFEVIDQGCGISPEDQERVFERFYQVERARSGSAADRGTGLGLSIVRHAVNAMEGEVSLRSQLGRGTSVSITIPQPAIM